MTPSPHSQMADTVRDSCLPRFLTVSLIQRSGHVYLSWVLDRGWRVPGQSDALILILVTPSFCRACTTASHYIHIFCTCTNITFTRIGSGVVDTYNRSLGLLTRPISGSTRVRLNDVRQEAEAKNVHRGRFLQTCFSDPIFDSTSIAVWSHYVKVLPQTHLKLGVPLFNPEVMKPSLITGSNGFWAASFRQTELDKLNTETRIHVMLTGTVFGTTQK